MWNNDYFSVLFSALTTYCNTHFLRNLIHRCFVHFLNICFIFFTCIFCLLLIRQIRDSFRINKVTIPFCFRLCWCGGWWLCVAVHSCFSLAAAAAAAAQCRRTPPYRRQLPQRISLNLATGFLRNSETVSWPVLGCMWTLWTMRKRGSLSESWIRILCGTSTRRITGTMWVCHLLSFLVCVCVILVSALQWQSSLTDFCNKNTRTKLLILNLKFYQPVGTEHRCIDYYQKELITKNEPSGQTFQAIL